MIEATTVPAHLLPARRYRKREQLRTLFFDLNAISDIERTTGRPIDRALTQGGTFASLRMLVWAGLLHESQDLTERDAGDLMQEASQSADSIAEYLEALNAVTLTALRNNELFQETGDEDEGEEDPTLKKDQLGPSDSSSKT